MTGLRCVDDPGPRVFAERAWAFLDRDPVGNNVLCTSIEAACVEEHPDWRWVRVLDGDELVGVAMHTPPRGPLLSELPEPAAHALVRHFAGTTAALSSVNGPPAAAAAFAAHYAGLTGMTTRPGERARLFRLDRVRSPIGVPGQSRAATAADRDLIRAWMDGFMAETARDDPMRAEREAAIERRFAHGDLMWLWEVDGVPVSFAWRSPLAPVTRWPRTTVVRVSAVYTPPELRGRGYASANVAAVSAAGLAAGARACMLYTDAANPTSNKIYQAVGYRPVGAAQEWRFS